MIITLIGMPGSGKTTIGKLLQNKGFKFIDTDEKIIEKEQRTINEIFATSGEEYFRTVETEVLKGVFNCDNLVISTGGGIVLKEENRKLLKENSICVYLKTTPDELFERVKNNTERPLLNSEDMKTKLETLYLKRKSLYEESAQIIINTKDKTPEEILEEITVKTNAKR